MCPVPAQMSDVARLPASFPSPRRKCPDFPCVAPGRMADHAIACLRRRAEREQHDVQLREPRAPRRGEHWRVGRQRHDPVPDGQPRPLVPPLVRSALQPSPKVILTSAPRRFHSHIDWHLQAYVSFRKSIHMTQLMFLNAEASPSFSQKTYRTSRARTPCLVSLSLPGCLFERG